MVLAAGRREIPKPSGFICGGSRTSGAVRYADRRKPGGAGGGGPRRCRAVVVDLAGAARAGSADALELRPACGPDRRPRRLSAPAAGGTCRHQPAIWPDQPSRGAGQVIGDRYRPHRIACDDRSRIRPYLRPRARVGRHEHRRQWDGRYPLEGAGRAGLEHRSAQSIRGSRPRTRRPYMRPTGTCSCSWSTIPIRSRWGAFRTARRTSISEGSIAGIRRWGRRHSAWRPSISARCVRTETCGAWRISRRSPSGTANMPRRASPMRRRPRWRASPIRARRLSSPASRPPASASLPARTTTAPEFLRKRGFSKPETARIIETVLREEGRPPESLFDFVQGITAVARDKEHQDARLELEQRAKRLLDRAT